MSVTVNGVLEVVRLRNLKETPGNPQAVTDLCLLAHREAYLIEKYIYMFKEQSALHQRNTKCQVSGDPTISSSLQKIALMNPVSQVNRFLFSKVDMPVPVCPKEASVETMMAKLNQIYSLVLVDAIKGTEQNLHIMCSHLTEVTNSLNKRAKHIQSSLPVTPTIRFPPRFTPSEYMSPSVTITSSYTKAVPLPFVHSEQQQVRLVPLDCSEQAYSVPC